MLDRDLPTDATRADVACAVARVYPAFEIIETRGDLSGQLALAITDNGQQKAFVLGEPVSRDALPELDVVTVRVRINGTEVATASGDAVLARPRGGLAPENQVRTGLPAGGSRIRTLGPPSEGQRFRDAPVQLAMAATAERSHARRFHSAARRSGAAPGGAQAWMRHRSRRPYLLVGHETVVPADDEKALPRWVEALVAFMQRNSALDRLFQAADRCGRRNRSGNIDLSRDQSR